MANDAFQNWAALIANLAPGRDFAVLSETRAQARWLIAAPHGGAIEPGTTQVAHAIAVPDMSFYSVEGRLDQDNFKLHLTSHHFDEPTFDSMVGSHDHVLAIHGCADNRLPSQTLVWVGGAGTVVRHRLIEALTKTGFLASLDTLTPGMDPTNICNRGARRAGVQLELTTGLRERLFSDLTGVGLRRPTPLLYEFVGIIRAVLHDAD